MGQRADAGLIVAEGAWPEVTVKFTVVSPASKLPLMCAAGAVTDAVHARGGSIVLQIMHSVVSAAAISNPLVCVPYRRPPFAGSGQDLDRCGRHAGFPTSPRH